jgi:hypothetical protein
VKSPAHARRRAHMRRGVTALFLLGCAQTPQEAPEGRQRVRDRRQGPRYRNVAGAVRRVDERAGLSYGAARRMTPSSPTAHPCEVPIKCRPRSVAWEFDVCFFHVTPPSALARIVPLSPAAQTCCHRRWSSRRFRDPKSFFRKIAEYGTVGGDPEGFVPRGGGPMDRLTTGPRAEIRKPDWSHNA